MSISRRRIGLLLAFFLLVEIAVQFSIRLDYGPDEPEHLEYLYVLATQFRLPTPAESHIVQHAPLYYAGLGLLWRAVGVSQPPMSVTPGRPGSAPMDSRSIVGRRMLRLANSLLACGTLLLLIRILVVLGVPPTWQIRLVALVALWPMFQYVSGMVNNENLSIFYSSVLALLIVSRIQAGTGTIRDAAFLGVLIGAGVWVKQTTLFALAPALWAIGTIQPRSQRLQRTAVFLLVALIVGIGWPLHNHIATGEWFPSYTVPLNQREQAAFALMHPFAARGLLGWTGKILVTSFLPDWAANFIPGEVLVSGIAVTAVLCSVAVLLAFGFRNSKPRHRHVAAVSLVAILLLLAGILHYCLEYDYRAQIGGRYLLNAIPWLAALAGAAVVSWRRLAEAARMLDLLTLLIGLLALFDLCWWYLAWTYYQNVAVR